MKTKLIKNFRSEHEVLTAPMSKKELENNVRKDGTIQAKVLIDLNDLINYDLEWFNDEVSDKITGSECGLTDIHYQAVGRTTDNDVIIKITAKVEFENL